MTASNTVDQIQTGPPRRFRAAPDRGRKLGSLLRAYWKLPEPTDAELNKIGDRLMQRDEPAAALVAAMRRPADDPERVTMRAFHTALEYGVPEDAPAPLRDFFDGVEAIPDWLDPQLCERGAQVFRRFGRNASDVLLQLALIGGYRFGGPVDLLAETGGMRAATAKRRLGETQTWAIAVGQPGGMRRDGDGWKLTVHVRLMHALVNESFERNGRWDPQQWGLPINQADLASTLNLFSGALMMGVRALGVPVTREESRAVMHLWRYVGWLVGVDEDWLFDNERDQHAHSYAVLLVQADVTDAGGQLAGVLVDVQRDLNYRLLPTLAGRYERERLLSMLEGFLGKRGMRDLRLPRRPPWAFGACWVRNSVSYRLIARSPLGPDYLDWLGERARRRATFRHFGDENAEIGKLPV